MATLELDAGMKVSLRALHSRTPDSTERLRLALDECIRATHGASKMLANTLPSKYLAEERDRHHQQRFSGSSSRTVPPPTQSPQQLQIPERSDDSGDELPFDLLEEDLTCAVCRQIAVQAGNRLVECDACHALYHQDCHKPIISDNDMNSGWQCAACLAALGFSVYKTTSKSSPTRVSKDSIKVSSSSSSSSSGSSKVVTPNINIISADKRIQNMKKKAAKQHEKRKHK